jgi:hypothetical protein
MKPFDTEEFSRRKTLWVLDDNIVEIEDGWKMEGNISYGDFLADDCCRFF